MLGDELSELIDRHDAAGQWIQMPLRFAELAFEAVMEMAMIRQLVELLREQSRSSARFWRTARRREFSSPESCSRDAPGALRLPVSWQRGRPHHCGELRALDSDMDVSRTTGTKRSFAIDLTTLHTSIPLRPGMLSSRTTRSTACARTASMAFCPLFAPTTVKPRARRSLDMRSRVARSSSATTTTAFSTAEQSPP